ncbi:MAG: chromosome segregation protein SMC, partial [Ferruginibacter sp.]
IDDLRRQNQSIQREQFEAEKKVAIADTSILNLQRTIAQIQEEKAQRRNQLQQLEPDKQKATEALEQKNADLRQLQEHHEFTKEQILQTQGKMEGLRNELAAESRTLDSKKNEHDLLKSLIDSMEGYPESVKFLHNNPNWNHTAPLLSDIIYVKEEYRAAVENVLEPYLNYYVVNNLEEGLQAIHLLDDNKKGKANFFLQDKFTDFETQHQPAGTIPALSVVEIDSKYANLAKYLLGNVFIAEDEDALRNSNGAVVLEKSGKYVKGKYSLTGGSVGLFEGKKIGRAKNLEKLIEEIAAQEAIVNTLKAAIQAHHQEVIAFNEQLKENAIRQVQQDISHLTNQVFSLQNKIENLTHLEETSAARVTELEKQLENNHNDIASTRETLDRFNTQIGELTEKMQLIEQDYATAEADYHKATATFNDSNLQFTKQQSKVVSLKQEFEFKNNQLSDLTIQIENSNAQLSEASASITETAAQLKELELLVITMLQNKETEEKALNQADQLYYNLRNTLAEKENAIRQVQQDISHLTNQVFSLQNKIENLTHLEETSA